MTCLRLQPADTFFFKGQQMAEAGADSVAGGLFPPRPNTIYGALRSAYIHQYTNFEDFRNGKNDHVKKWMGTPKQTGDFALRYCALAEGDSLLLPLPLDYQVIETPENKSKAIPLVLTHDNGHSSIQSPFRLMSTVNKKSKSAAKLFIPAKILASAMLKGEEISEIIHISDIIVEEPKTGIALEYEHRRAREHYLYQIKMLRFKYDGGLIAFMETAPNFESIPFARVGGENRPWSVLQENQSFHLWNDDEKHVMKEKLLTTGIARIVLLSPAIWSQGARPATLKDKTFHLTKDLEVEWLTAAIGRPGLYGGWDIVKHRPKPRQVIVPAGSVIYVKVQDKDVDELMKLADGFHLTDQNNHEGFGFAVVTPGQFTDQ